MKMLISVLGIRVSLIILGLYVYSIYLNVQMDWKRSVLVEELNELHSQKEILVQNMAKAVTENEELQALLISLENTSHNQKLVIVLVTIYIITVITAAIFRVVNAYPTILDIPASVFNIVDISQVGVMSTMDAHKQTLRTISDLKVQIAESNAHIHSLILASENLTHEIAIFQSQPLLEISPDIISAVSSAGGTFGVF